MNRFDDEVKNMIQKETLPVPDHVHEMIENTLETLPINDRRPTRIRIFPRVMVAAASVALVTMVLLPNVSKVYAQEISKIPILGELVQVFTFRNYSYSDDSHEMNIDVPNVTDKTSEEAANRINMSVDELTRDLVNKFYAEVELAGDTGYGSTQVDYDTVANTPDWFTLKLSVTQISGSSDQYYKFYHIDRRTGQYIELKDLFTSEDYREVIMNNIKEQMKEQMKQDESIQYFVDDALIGEEFASIDENQNFYINEQNQLVIVFDKYEVGPGSIGCPEFVIDKTVIKDSMKPEFSKLIQ